MAEPKKVEHFEVDEPMNTALNALSFGFWGLPGTTHSTVITGPNGATYTGNGETEEEANRVAGERYRTGDSDDDD
jgi:hypothetical protein